MSVKVITGNCLEVLSEIEPGSIDLVLCDPPYGKTQNGWDVEIENDLLWPMLWNVCSKTIILTAIQPFSSRLVCHQIDYFKHEWIWHKSKATGHLNAGHTPLRAHENILVFSKSKALYNPQMTTGHNPGNYAVRRKFTPNYGEQKPTEYGGKTTRYPRSVVSFPVVNNDDKERFHPTQKPVDLMRYLIRTYSNPGDVVLDFAAGSGTCGEAALIEGRDALLIEADPSYADQARARLERFVPNLLHRSGSL